MTPRYVNHSGYVSSRRIRANNFSLSRLFYIFCIIALLVSTNPAHMNAGFWNQNVSRKVNSRRFQSEFFGIDVQVNFNSPKTWWAGTSASTNYFLFSLSKQSRGVDLEILMNTFTLCKYDGFAPAICEWVSANGCHEMKMFDPGNRPFTFLRMIQVIKFTSWLMQCNYNCGTLFPAAFEHGYNPMFSAILSTLHQPVWYQDFLVLNTFVYPFLKLLDMVAWGATPTNDAASLYFYGLAFSSIFIVGAISNLIAAYVTNEEIRGMTASFASVLGYYAAAKPHKVILNYLDVQLTSGDLFFGIFSITTACYILGLNHLLGKWRISDSVAWGCGGFMGFFLRRWW